MVILIAFPVILNYFYQSDLVLVPELGQENILVDITPSETSLIDPLTQELSLTQSEIVLDETDLDNNSSSNNTSSFNSIVVANIDPLVGVNPQEFQVSEIDVNDTSFAPPQSKLTFQGGFGDFNGGNDVTLEIKDTDGNVAETFRLTGEGQASLYRDEEYQYIFFSGVDETTKIDIDSTSNIKFGNYIGDSLKIETTGSIEGGDIILSEPDETGLVLKSGLESASSSKFAAYDVINVSYIPGFDDRVIYSRATDINNYGNVVGEVELEYDYNSNVYTHRRGFYRHGVTWTIGTSYLNYHAHAHGINDSSQAVGYIVGGGDFTSFLYDDTTSELNLALDADTVPRPNNVAFAINNSGQVVGSTQNGSHRAVIYDDGAVNDLGVLPGDNSSFAYGINNLGQVIGTSVKQGRYDDNTGYVAPVNSAFIYEDGQMIDLGVLPGHSDSSAYRINDLGQIVGVSGNSSNVRAFVYEDSLMKDLGVLAGDLGSKASGINDLGQIVGTSFKEQLNSKIFRLEHKILPEESRAFLYKNNQMIDLNNFIASDSGWTLKNAVDINNRGQIVGDGIFQGKRRAFLLNLSSG